MVNIGALFLVLFSISCIGIIATNRDMIKQIDKYLNRFAVRYKVDLNSEWERTNLLKGSPVYIDHFTLSNILNLRDNDYIEITSIDDKEWLVTNLGNRLYEFKKKFD